MHHHSQRSRSARADLKYQESPPQTHKSGRYKPKGILISRYLWQFPGIGAPEERRGWAETDGSSPAEDMLGNRPIQGQNRQLIAYFHWTVAAKSGERNAIKKQSYKGEESVGRSEQEAP